MAARKLVIPEFIREIVESIAFVARQEKRVDKRSGVSQRVPITCLENVLSSAEYRAVKNHEDKTVPGPSDIYTAMPSLTGKVELEYEGEMRGRTTWCATSSGRLRLASSRSITMEFLSIPLFSGSSWAEH